MRAPTGAATTGFFHHFKLIREGGISAKMVVAGEAYVIPVWIPTFAEFAPDGRVITDSQRSLRYQTTGGGLIERMAQRLRIRALESQSEIPDTSKILGEVSSMWGQTTDARRLDALERLPLVLNESLEWVELQLEFLTGLLDEEYLRRWVASELGCRSETLLWRGGAEVHRRWEPLGLVVHVLGGEGPLESALAIVISLLSGNRALLLTSPREPYFAAAFARSIEKVWPQVREWVAVVHPESSQAEMFESLFSRSVHACVRWNAADRDAALAGLSARFGVQFVECDREVVIQVLEIEDYAEVEGLADQVARDCLWWPPRVIFVHELVDGPRADEFATALKEAVNRLAETIPRRRQLKAAGQRRGNWPYPVRFVQELKQSVTESAQDSLIVTPVRGLQEVLDYVTGRRLELAHPALAYHGSDERFLARAVRVGFSRVTTPGCQLSWLPGGTLRKLVRPVTREL